MMNVKIKEIDTLKREIINLLERKGDLTLQRIYKELKYFDDFKVASAIARLESEERIVGSGEKIIYREDGGAILLGKYKKV